jgi:hypothetical protein
MSKLRPTYPSNKPAPSYEDALYMIRDAVERQDGLIHGALHGDGMHCAIGAFFTDSPHLALNDKIIDEVAAYNDSIPFGVDSRIRRNKVLEWLNFRLALLIPRQRLRAVPDAPSKRTKKDAA